MRYFKSDNTAAVSREILDALAVANTGVALAFRAGEHIARFARRSEI
jgi:threonine aldolase